MRGRRVAVVMGEFGVPGRVDRPRRRRPAGGGRSSARPSEGLPLLAGPVSGGTRMQEGTPAFVQMVRISQAVAAHKAAGLPYLVYLRHPTTGGVMASWGSLGHVTVAEPGALVGLPRPAGLRGALRPASSPRACRPRRTSTPTASSTPSSPPTRSPTSSTGLLDDPAWRPGRASPPFPRPPDDADPRRRHVGRRHPVPAAATGPAYAGC